jgi:hypothetical protein
MSAGEPPAWLKPEASNYHSVALPSCCKAVGIFTFLIKMVVGPWRALMHLATRETYIEPSREHTKIRSIPARYGCHPLCLSMRGYRYRTELRPFLFFVVFVFDSFWFDSFWFDWFFIHMTCNFLMFIPTFVHHHCISDPGKSIIQRTSGQGQFWVVDGVISVQCSGCNCDTSDLCCKPCFTQYCEHHWCSCDVNVLALLQHPYNSHDHERNNQIKTKKSKVHGKI